MKGKMVLKCANQPRPFHVLSNFIAVRKVVKP